MKNLKKIDPQIYQVIHNEILRQDGNLELIASENFAPLAVMEVQGSVLTNKYAEGYPGRRWYGGCEFVDQAESLAINLFGPPPVLPLSSTDFKSSFLTVSIDFSPSAAPFVLE